MYIYLFYIFKYIVYCINLYLIFEIFIIRYWYNFLELMVVCMRVIYGVFEIKFRKSRKFIFLDLIVKNFFGEINLGL